MKFVPYLTFNGQAKEALDFYSEVFGAEIEALQTFEAMPAAEGAPQPSNPKHIMHGRIRIGDAVVMASDSFDGKTAAAYTGMSISAQIDDLETARRAFDRLAEEGQVSMPFEATFWAKGFGVVRDKFGISWMVNCE